MNLIETREAQDARRAEASQVLFERFRRDGDKWLRSLWCPGGVCFMPEDDGPPAYTLLSWPKEEP